MTGTPLLDELLLELELLELELELLELELLLELAPGMTTMPELLLEELDELELATPEELDELELAMPDELEELEFASPEELLELEELPEPVSGSVITLPPSLELLLHPASSKLLSTDDTKVSRSLFVEVLIIVAPCDPVGMNAFCINCVY